MVYYYSIFSFTKAIVECKKKNVSEDGTNDSCNDSECENLSSRPVSREQQREESTINSKCASPCSNRGIVACLDHNEQEIKERLLKLEKINLAFEKELELREAFYIEKEKKYGKWMQVEQCFIFDLKQLSEERDLLVGQVEQLQSEKEALIARVSVLQNELDDVRESHCLEAGQLKLIREKVITELQQEVDQLLAKEKTHLKQITSLKLEKMSDKSESDKLKSSYVELQLELSRTREEMRRKDEDFRIRLADTRSKHMKEETRLLGELDVLRSKNRNCDEMIKHFQLRHNELVFIVSQKELDLEKAREEYQKSMETTEEAHRDIEAALKRQLRLMEEETSVATRALTEERIRLERELQENIDDLRCKEEVYKARIAELENNVTLLHEALQRITGDIHAGLGPEIDNGCISTFRREKLLSQVKELRERETELREKLDEMEQKEAAYRETLQHADRIVATVEQGYKNKIEELEISERNLKLRVGHLEEVENNLRGALHKERRSSDGRKPDDLVVELLEAEAREIGLKEKVERLEQQQRMSMNKVKDLEKIRGNLESQLSDKEELVETIEKIQNELDIARKSLAKLKTAERDLKSNLQHTEHILATTDAQMKTKLKVMEEEKKGLGETIDELRVQVRELKLKLELLSYEKEQAKFSAVIPTASSRDTELDEPDYVDVDDCVSEPKEVKGEFCTIPKKTNSVKLTPDPSINFASIYGNKNVTPAAVESKIKQSPIPTAPDSYDDARHNLEHCMLRAMAAMKDDIQRKNARKQTGNSENDYDDVLPRPTDFRIVQQVGSDTLLVGWNYVNPSLLEGFELYLNGQLHETVYAPDRTKALINGLNLRKPVQLSICALSRYGQMSEPVFLDPSAPPEKNNEFDVQDADDDEEEGNDENLYEKKRPYSMEW